MTRPTDHDAAFEAELAALAPAAPSADLRRRVAEALAAAPTSAAQAVPALPVLRAVRPAPARWLTERLLWASGGAAAGAVAASLALAPAVIARQAAPVAASVPPSAAVATTITEPPVEVAEESVAWADAGVQFIDDRTPARILRRVAVERHRPAGGSEYRVPREDVILVPVALR